MLGSEKFCWKSLGSQIGPGAKSICAAEGAKVPLPKRPGKLNIDLFILTSLVHPVISSQQNTAVRDIAKSLGIDEFWLGANDAG